MGGVKQLKPLASMTQNIKLEILSGRRQFFDFTAIGYFENKLIMIKNNNIMTFDGDKIRKLSNFSRSSSIEPETCGVLDTTNGIVHVFLDDQNSIKHMTYNIQSNQWSIEQSVANYTPAFCFVSNPINQLYSLRNYDAVITQNSDIVYVESMQRFYAVNIWSYSDNKIIHTDYMYDCNIHEMKWNKLPYAYPNQFIETNNNGLETLRCGPTHFALVAHIMFVFNFCNLKREYEPDCYNEIFAIDLWYG
eukprot:133507_1